MKFTASTLQIFTNGAAQHKLHGDSDLIGRVWGLFPVK